MEFIGRSSLLMALSLFVLAGCSSVPQQDQESSRIQFGNQGDFRDGSPDDSNSDGFDGNSSGSDSGGGGEPTPEPAVAPRIISPAEGELVTSADSGSFLFSGECPLNDSTIVIAGDLETPVDGDSAIKCLNNEWSHSQSLNSLDDGVVQIQVEIPTASGSDFLSRSFHLQKDSPNLSLEVFPMVSNSRSRTISGGCQFYGAGSASNQVLLYEGDFNFANMNCTSTEQFIVQRTMAESQDGSVLFRATQTDPYGNTQNIQLQAHLICQNGDELISGSQLWSRVSSNPHGCYIVESDGIGPDGDYNGNLEIILPNFYGRIDGQGHIISDTHIRNGPRYAGLFGQNFGEIKNISFLNTRLEAEGDIGGLVQQNRGLIDNVDYEADIVATTEDSFNDDASGFTGFNFGEIRRSSFTGSIHAPGIKSGIARWNYGLIIDSYTRFEASGGPSAAGITYHNDVLPHLGMAGEIVRVYSVLRHLSGATSQVSGIARFSEPGTVAQSNYYDKDVCDCSSAIGGGRNTIEMSQQSTYTNWPFPNPWYFPASNGYPELQ